MYVLKIADLCNALVLQTKISRKLRDVVQLVSETDI